MKHQLKFENEFRIKGTAPDGRAREQVVYNTLTYAAADVMIRAMLANGPARVTHLYLQHGGSTNTASVSLPADQRTTLRSDFVATAVSNDNGGMWVPILAAPSVEATDPTFYAGNRARYFFRIPGSPQAGQYTGSFTPGTSLIYSIGLAVATDVNNRAGDQIISVANDFTPFVIASGGQEAVDYPYNITIPEE